MRIVRRHGACISKLLTNSSSKVASVKDLPAASRDRGRVSVVPNLRTVALDLLNDTAASLLLEKERNKSVSE